MDDIVARIYRQDSRRVFSTLVPLLGRFEAAEDAFIRHLLPPLSNGQPIPMH